MSEIRTNLLSNAAGTGSAALFKQYASKMWCKFNGSTNVINDSRNMSSLTDNGTGDYDINYTSAMSSGNYGASGLADFGIIFKGAAFPATTTKIVIQTINTTTASATDRNIVAVAIDGDLA